MEIKEYLQKMLDRWNKYDELDGFVAENFRVDLEKTLEYWDLRIADNKEELDKAREEGEIKGRLEALPITTEEIKNAKMKLLKRIISKYRKMGSSAGDYAMVYIEEELSKLKTKEDESKNKR